MGAVPSGPLIKSATDIEILYCVSIKCITIITNKDDSIKYICKKISTH